MSFRCAECKADIATYAQAVAICPRGKHRERHYLDADAWRALTQEREREPCHTCDDAGCPTLTLPNRPPCGSDGHGTGAVEWSFGGTPGNCDRDRDPGYGQSEPLLCKSCEYHNETVRNARDWCNDRAVDWRGEALASRKALTAAGALADACKNDSRYADFVAAYRRARG